MASWWDRLRDRLAPPPDIGPVRGPASHREPDPLRTALPPGYPRTFAAESPTAAGPERPLVFEPALKHYGRAFRLGDPTFSDTEEGLRWAVARSRAMRHVLALVA